MAIRFAIGRCCVQSNNGNAKSTISKTFTKIRIKGSLLERRMELWDQENYWTEQSLFCKKGVLKNFAKFTGKHLYHSLFFNKVAGLRLLLKKVETIQEWLKTTNAVSIISVISKKFNGEIRRG